MCMSRGIFTCEPLKTVQVYAEFDSATFHRRQQQHVNTRFENRHTTKNSSGYIGVALNPTVWGGRVKYGRTPYLNILFV